MKYESIFKPYYQTTTPRKKIFSPVRKIDYTQAANEPYENYHPDNLEDEKRNQKFYSIPLEDEEIDFWEGIL